MAAIRSPNILFINLPSIPYESILEIFSRPNEMVQSLSMPMGILYVSSYLKKNSDCLGKVSILDFALHISEVSHYKDIDDFIVKTVKKCVHFNPDILAFSLLFSTSHQFFVLLLDTLKVFWPKAISIVGGNHATNCITYLLENKYVDYVARGDGEIAFSEFVNKYSNLLPIEAKGIYSKKDMDSGASLELGARSDDMNEIPFPDWDLIDMEAYCNATGRRRNIGDSTTCKAATIITTRGCPFRCTFCASHTVHGRKVRYRSIDNVIEEIKILHERYDVSLLIPEDDLFTADKRRTIQLLSAIRNLEIPHLELQFPNALSIAALDEEIIDALIEAGMKIANLGIESGSEYVQKNIIRKNCDLKKARRIVTYLKDRGIMARCYFIFGFPKETKDQMLETIRFAKGLGADWCAFSMCTPLIGSEAYEQFVQMGYIHNDPATWSTAFFQKRSFDTTEISADELNDLVYRANLEVNFIHNPNIVHGDFNKAVEIFNDIIMSYPFHIVAWYCIMQCYKGLRDAEKADEIVKKMRSLLQTDDRAADMFAKYTDLLEGFNA